MDDGKRASPRWLKRAAKAVGALAAGVAVVVLLAVVLLLLPFVRSHVMREALSHADKALPGNITAAGASWPSIDTIDLRDINWTDGFDSLLSAERVRVSVELVSLVKRDIRVESAFVEGLSADIPAIASRFSTKEKTTAEREKGSSVFPRPGSLPGVPSVAIERMRVTAPFVRWNDAVSLTGVTIDAGLDVSHGASPWVRVDSLELVGPDSTWRVDELSLYVAPGKGLLKGEGTGTVSPHGSVHLSITPQEKDRFKMALATRTNEMTDGWKEAGIDLDIILAREGVRLSSVSFEGHVRTPGTRGLSKYPRLTQRVEGLPDLDGLRLSLRGTVGFTENLTADISCDIERNNWLDGGAFTLKYNEDGLSLDEIAVAAPGLSIAGNVSMGTDSLKAAFDLRVTGTRWIKTFRPNVNLPEPFSAAVVVEASRGGDSPIVHANVTGEGRVVGFSLDRFRVRSDFSLDDAAPSSIVLNAETMGLHIGLAAEVLRKPDVEARLAPIVIRGAPIPLSSIAFDRRRAGSLRYSVDGKEVFADDLRVTGDFGDLSIDADLDSLRRGPFSVACTLRRPPPPLAKVLGLTEEDKQRLERDWTADAPFSVETEGELIGSEGPQILTSGTFRLPGPRNIGVFLPDSASFDDLGPVEGTFSLSTTRGPEGADVDARIDLRETAWIDSSAFHLVKRGGQVAVDTVGIAFEGTAIGVRGTIERGVFDMSANLLVSDSRGLRRFSRAAPEVALRGRAHLGGTRLRPTLEAAVEGSVQGTSYHVPEFTLVADLDTARVRAVLSAPGGISTSHVRLDRLEARVESFESVTGLFPVRLTVDAAGERLAIHQSLRADTAGGIHVEVDTLDLLLAGRELRARRPFQARLLSRPQGVSIDGVDLAGSLGSVRLTALLRPDSSDVAGVVTIDLPEEPPPALTRAHLWPERIDVDLQAKGASDAAASVDVRGFILVDERRPLLHAEVKCDAEWIAGVLSVGDSLGDIVTARGRLPASMRIYPPSFALRDGPTSFEAFLDRVPAITRLIGPSGKIPRDEIIRINGHIVAGGTTASPNAITSLSLEFEDWPKLSQYRARIEAGLGSRSGADSLETRSRTAISQDLRTAWGEETGLAGFLALEREGRTVLTARGRHPLHVSLHPPGARTPQDGRVDLRIESEEIPLADFDPLLPLNVGLGGLITLELAGSGPSKDFSLDGSVTARDFEISVAQEAQVVAQVNLRLSGSSRRPVVKGNVEVVKGLIRVPEIPQSLHPLEGEALLWRDSLAVALRDSVVEVETFPAPPEQTEERASEPDFDVAIRIPSNFWIRGKGLDIELMGNLNIKQKGGKPIVAGELRAARGTLVFLGRTLDLERGTVTFYGGDEVDPSLDIVLRTTVEGNKIQILFGGTVKKPQVDLTSEPDMAEADIMSVLLFGRTFEDLDDDQANLVRRRSAEMIASLGAVKLQEEVGGQLGVDVVTVTSTGRDKEGTALSFGKYLNTRTLLSYAYPLDSESRSFVSLEYFLKGRFVIRSTYDNQGVGSLGVGWSKDY